MILSTGKVFHLQHQTNEPIRSPLARCKPSPPFAQTVDGNMEWRTSFAEDAGPKGLLDFFDPLEYSNLLM
jgi:hypothetical protein